jgi:hypothetical protein
MYSRSRNENGSLNTRCLCFLITIASEIEIESELERIDARHICPEKALTQLLALKRTVLLQTPTNNR